MILNIQKRDIRYSRQRCPVSELHPNPYNNIKHKKTRFKKYFFELTNFRT